MIDWWKDFFTALIVLPLLVSAVVLVLSLLYLLVVNFGMYIIFWIPVVIFIYLAISYANDQR